MTPLRGRVRGGHIEIDGALPEGAEVGVLTPGHDEPFELDEAQLAELESLDPRPGPAAALTAHLTPTPQSLFKRAKPESEVEKRPE